MNDLSLVKDFISSGFLYIIFAYWLTNWNFVDISNLITLSSEILTYFSILTYVTIHLLIHFTLYMLYIETTLSLVIICNIYFVYIRQNIRENSQIPIHNCRGNFSFHVYTCFHSDVSFCSYKYRLLFFPLYLCMVVPF